jgi:hypothetical protein
VQAVLRKLARFDPTLPTTEKASFELATQALSLVDGLTWELSPDRAPGIAVSDRVFRTSALLAPPASVLLFTNSLTPGGQVPIPPDEAARILRELLRILEDAVRRAGSGNGNLARARELLEFLRRYIAAVAGGGAVTLSELAAFLRPFLAELLGILRGFFGREAWMALGRAIVQAITGLAQGLGGTACAAPVAFVWYIVAVLAAAGLGFLIGRLIGGINIGGKTVDEYVAGFFYWLFYAPPDGCVEALDGYLKALERSRQLEAAGAAKEAVIAALSEAVSMLSIYIQLKCEDDLSGLQNQLDFLLQKLKRLVG